MQTGDASYHQKVGTTLLLHDVLRKKKDHVTKLTVKMNGGEKVLYNISHMGESLACHKCTFIKGFVIRNKVVR